MSERPSGEGARRVLCAHADQNGEGAHWKNEGEPCCVELTDKRSPCADSAMRVESIRASLTTGPDGDYYRRNPTALAVVSVLVSRLEAVLDLHECRRRDVDGFTLTWCRECGQNWPCPTVTAAQTAPPVFDRPQHSDGYPASGGAS